MVMSPRGVGTVMRTSRAPPTRSCQVTTSTEAPFGPYQLLNSSGSIHICHTTSRGASNCRSRTTASSVRVASLIRSGPSTIGSVFDAVVHAVEPLLPDASGVCRPGRDLAQRRRVQRAGSVLRPMTANDQPGMLEDLDVLRDRGRR